MGSPTIFNELSLYSGTAGFTLGLRLARIPVRTVCYVEIEPYRVDRLAALGDGIVPAVVAEFLRRVTAVECK